MSLRYNKGMYRNRNSSLLCFALSLFGPSLVLAGLQIQVGTSDPSPSTVGTFVTWNVQATDSDEGSLWYRFRMREANEADFHVMRDFGPSSEWIWAAVEHEGQFEIEVAVRNLATGSITETVSSYLVKSALVNNRAMVQTTPNPLVFVYSAPSCRVGLSMRVTFSTAGVNAVNTQAKACDGTHSMNFYLAGLYGDTRYNARHQTLSATGQVTATGPPVEFTAGSVPPIFANYSVTAGAAGSGVLVRSPLNSPIAATDLDGNVIWFYQYALDFLTRAEAGGYFWGFRQAGPLGEQSVRKIDLAGIAVLETNAARISEQLVARGERPITSLHHELASMPDGGVLVLATVAEPGEKWFYKKGDVFGDKIIVLDRDLNVVWTWDAFDHIDPINLPPILGETCRFAGCPPAYSNSDALDWMHANSIQLTPDGNLLLSVRHLDLLLKIDYANGSGAILWKLGKGGDFQMQPQQDSDWPWFSHQHDANFLDEKTILLFDNGNTRLASGASNELTSRGQLIEVDETTMTARLLRNIDLGAYSAALGSAQRLPSGNYHFTVGFLPGFIGYAVEVSPGGELLYRIDSSSAEYRSIRMKDLYSGPE